jgi:hypothetical protein
MHAGQPASVTLHDDGSQPSVIGQSLVALAPLGAHSRETLIGRDHGAEDPRLLSLKHERETLVT